VNRGRTRRAQRIALGTCGVNAQEVNDMGAVDKMKDKAQETKGAAKEKVGDATDNRDLEAEGRMDKAAGSLKGAGEKVKDAIE
jgi:uncharacterized protein YjbJ (UPF0337 family)